ncbi:hypothetical protein ANN_04830 [Periplaneta americana]|uniref:Uncharacterized protein n=1 Tax=Periplaneta americana TaxID=6978 RepID=A0ABQ8TBF6_PERAM|nr:hypothetical protein ANN_04830 [Periplaneta americana]
MDLREVGYDDKDWINLAQDRDRWRAYVGFMRAGPRKGSYTYVRHGLVHCAANICDDSPSPIGGLGGIRESDADRWAILPQPLIEPGPVSRRSSLISPTGPKPQALPISTPEARTIPKILPQPIIIICR